MIRITLKDNGSNAVVIVSEAIRLALVEGMLVVFWDNNKQTLYPFTEIQSIEINDPGLWLFTTELPPEVQP